MFDNDAQLVSTDQHSFKRITNVHTGAERCRKHVFPGSCCGATLLRSPLVQRLPD